MSEDEDEDEHNANDGHDHSQLLMRPSLLLSGPYRYQVIEIYIVIFQKNYLISYIVQVLLKNPDLVKTITFTAKLNNQTDLFDFRGGLTTKTQTNQIKKTLDITYLSKNNR